jgi:hypothetical protein
MSLGKPGSIFFLASLYLEGHDNTQRPWYQCLVMSTWYYVSLLGMRKLGRFGWQITAVMQELSTYSNSILHYPCIR